MLRYVPLPVVAALAMLPISGVVQGQEGPREIKDPTGLFQDLDIDIDLKGKAGGPRVIIRGDAKATPGSHWLGLMLNPESDGEGAAVLDVQVGSPAAKAGVKKGDVVLELGDKKIKGPAALADRVKEIGGKKTKILVQRGDRKLSVEVTPARRDIVKVGDSFQQWWKELATKPDPSRRLLLLGPGMVFPRDAARMISPRLPKDFSFQVQGQGEDKPAKIVIKKDGKTWTVTEDKWDDIPLEIRNMLPPMHKHGIAVMGGEGGRVLIDGPAHGRVAPARVRVEAPAFPSSRKVQQLEKMIQQLMRDVQGLKHEHDHEHGDDAEDAVEDAAAEDAADDAEDIVEETIRVSPKSLAETIQNAVRKALGSTGRVRVEVKGAGEADEADDYEAPAEVEKASEASEE